MTTEEASQAPRGADGRISQAIFGIGMFVGVFVTGWALLVALAVVWWRGTKINGQSISLKSKILLSLVICAFATPAVMAALKAYEASLPTCSNAGVVATTQSIIAEKLLMDPSFKPVLTGIRTVEGRCKAQVNLGSRSVGLFSGEQTVTYSIEPTDDGANYYVSARFGNF